MNDKIEQLRVILESQQDRIITREEASEMGESLMSFFETLGEEPLQEVEHPEPCALGADHG